MTTWQRRAAFLVWGTPDLGPRSRVLARELGIDEIVYIHTDLRRGALSTLLRYPIQAVRTIRWLARVRPAVVFVQHPPSVPAWIVALYCRMRRARYVMDCHSATFQVAHWGWPPWVHHRLFRDAAAVLVTDPLWAEEVERHGGNAVVIPDIPVQHGETEAYDFGPGKSLAVVNTWAGDEPLDQVIEAARQLDDVTLYVTGRTTRVKERFPELPDNVRFTGFLSTAGYLGLLEGADAVMCLTTRDHTMQRGACESMAMGTPVITSDWPLLRGHFAEGAVYVDDTSEGIAGGVAAMMKENESFRRDILAVRERRRAEWLERKGALSQTMQDGLGEGRARGRTVDDS